MHSWPDRVRRPTRKDLLPPSTNDGTRISAARAELRDAQALLSAGVEIGLGLNHTNRSMGLFDVYPFVLSETARDKLAFVHGAIRGGAPETRTRSKGTGRRFWNLFRPGPVTPS